MFYTNICSFQNYTFEKEKKNQKKILMIPKKKTLCLPFSKLDKYFNGCT